MTRNSVKAVLLLAGDGGRLRPYTATRHKSLIPIAGKPILWYSMMNLIQLGISEYILVLGHQAESVKSYIQTTFPNSMCTYVINDRYRETNVVYSFYLACTHLQNSGFLRVEGDLLYNRAIARRLLDSGKQLVSAVEPRDRRSAEEFCVQVDKASHTILRYGKNLPNRSVYGIAQGIDFVSQKAAWSVSQELARIVEEGNLDQYAEYAFERLSQRSVYHPSYCDIQASDFWCDIDTAEDILYATKHIDKLT